MRPSVAAESRRAERNQPHALPDGLPGKSIAFQFGLDLGPLLPQTVHVWAINVDRLFETNRYFASLSVAEQRRAQAFASGRDRHRFISRRGALRQLLGRYLALEASDIEIDEGDGRKPALAGPHRRYGAAVASSGLRFNSSQSDGLALFAFAQDMAIGIDLERLRPMPEAEDIAQQYFSPHEYRALMNIPPQNRLAAFYACWTQKEAIVKALGHGLAMPLDSFAVSLAPDQRARLTHLDSGRPDDWTLEPLQPSPGYFAALAIGARHPVSVVTTWG